MATPGFTAEASFSRVQHYHKANAGAAVDHRLVRPSLYRVGSWDTDLRFLCYINCLGRGSSEDSCIAQCSYQVFDPTGGSGGTGSKLQA
jgi:hypothetical protein